MKFSVLTLFPEIIEAVAGSSILGRAIKNKTLEIESIQIREFASNRHKTVDDAPFGGGAGMLLKADVLAEAHRSLPIAEKDERRRTLLLSPQGRPLDQAKALELAENYDHLILVCGHYEGVDERFIQEFVDEEVSIGDFVLTGGELPALCLIDAVSRGVSGVVGKDESVTEDSLYHGLLKYPQYTRPQEWEGKTVPEVLLSGDHKKIAKWRQEQRESVTEAKRPDLFKRWKPK